MSNSILSNEGVVPLHHCQMPSLQEHSATWGEMIPGPNPKRDLLKIFICNSRIRRRHVERLHDPNPTAYAPPLFLAPCVRLVWAAFSRGFHFGWASCLLDTKVNLRPTVSFRGWVSRSPLQRPAANIQSAIMMMVIPVANIQSFSGSKPPGQHRQHDSEADQSDGVFRWLKTYLEDLSLSIGGLHGLPDSQTSAMKF